MNYFLWIKRELMFYMTDNKRKFIKTKNEFTYQDSSSLIEMQKVRYVPNRYEGTNLNPAPWVKLESNRTYLCEAWIGILRLEWSLNRIGQGRRLEWSLNRNPAQNRFQFRENRFQADGCSDGVDWRRAEVWGVALVKKEEKGTRLLVEIVVSG